MLEHDININNYITINRRLFKHPLWDEKRPFSRFEAWVDLLQSARFEIMEARKLIDGKMVIWGRGELPASLRFLGERWEWSKNKVDNFLKMLENEKMITKRTAKGTNQTIITLCNYDSYNIRAKKEGQQEGQTRDSRGTAEGQTRDKTNKDNKGNKGKNVGEVREQTPFPPDEQLLPLGSTSQILKPPTHSEVKQYFFLYRRQGWSDVKCTVEATNFYDHYEAIGWVNGSGVKILNWQASARKWINKDTDFTSNPTEKKMVQ